MYLVWKLSRYPYIGNFKLVSTGIIICTGHKYCKNYKLQNVPNIKKVYLSTNLFLLFFTKGKVNLILQFLSFSSYHLIRVNIFCKTFKFDQCKRLEKECRWSSFLCFLKVKIFQTVCWEIWNQNVYFRKSNEKCFSLKNLWNTCLQIQNSTWSEARGFCHISPERKAIVLLVLIELESHDSPFLL